MMAKLTRAEPFVKQSHIRSVIIKIGKLREKMNPLHSPDGCSGPTVGYGRIEKS